MEELPAGVLQGATIAAARMCDYLRTPLASSASRTSAPIIPTRTDKSGEFDAVEHPARKTSEPLKISSGLYHLSRFLSRTGPASRVDQVEFVLLTKYSIEISSTYWPSGN